MATDVDMADESTYDSCKWDLLIGDDATVVLVQRDVQIELPELETFVEVD